MDEDDKVSIHTALEMFTSGQLLFLGSMLRLELSTQLGYEVLDENCDFIFNVHAAHMPARMARGMDYGADPVPNGRGERVTPQHVGYALSTDGP